MSDGTHQTLRPGHLFAGRYEVQGVLGAGGMGAVYRVLDRLLEEVVALKLARADAAPSERAIVEQRNEVSLARRVTHPNVARVFDLGRHDGRFYITMELVPGDSVRALLRGGRRDPAQAVLIGHQVASALAAAHDAGVLHLDLKPENIVVVDGVTPRAVLVDFGVARALGTHAAGVGTLDYMAPEQLEDAPLAGAADVYALGLVLYELLCGRRPFPAGTQQERLVARLLRSPAPVEDDVDPDLAAFVMRCLSRAPADRPTAREVELTLAARLARSQAAPAGAPAIALRSVVDLCALAGGHARRLARVRRTLMRVGHELDALRELDLVLAAAPDLDVAVALNALAAVRAWNRAGVGISLGEATDRATAAVAAAVARAPHLADTHLADALIADYGGDVAYAVRALRRGLAHDPLHAWSHEVLGRIELEAGLDGEERVRLAHDLDAAQVTGLISLARTRFFEARFADAAELLAVADDARPGGVEAGSLRVRAALWFGDAALARTVRDIVEGSAPIMRNVREMAGVVLGECSVEACTEHIVTLLTQAAAPKRRAFLHQLAAEVLAGVDPTRALEHVVSAVRLPLSDLAWMDACPVLEPLRTEPAFRAARATVQQRVALAFGVVGATAGVAGADEQTELLPIDVRALE